jgi:lipid II:glycine glycyltransferase (peptidoglycan interpeptide bridge formation enzyme)
MDRQHWNQVVADNAPPFGAFLQSWEWGAFQRSLGRRVERLLEENGGIFLAQAIKMDLPLGQHYWFVPKGPLGTVSSQDMVAKLRDGLSDGVFFRIEPPVDPKTVKVEDVHPAHSLVLDLNKSEDELLSEMKSKTRYNIRLANRKGVECKHVGMEYFDDFIRLLDQTAVRDHIRSHPKDYYKAMLTAMRGGEAKAFLAMAFFDGRPIAANVIVDFAGQRTYVHGATSNLHRNVMAQYALHWFLIQEAKEAGMKSFDFYGIAPDGAGKNHPWYGITRYKRGYGGELIETPGTYELQTKHIWYGAYRIAKKIRRIK